jgi:16S rRNA C967 or C1407 C5-methylase (RsmB/RsmF family)
LTDLPDAGGTEDFLRLTPLKQGVDGFFAAVMTRVFS